MNKVLIKSSHVNILSILLSILTLSLFGFFQISCLNFKYIKVTFPILFLFILIPILHELLHLICFLVIAKIKYNDIIFKPNESSKIPYFRTLMPMHRNIFILVLLSPAILLTFLSILLIFFSQNLMYSAIASYSFSIAAGDLMMTYKLMETNKNAKVIPLVKQLGFKIMD